MEREIVCGRDVYLYFVILTVMHLCTVVDCGKKTLASVNGLFRTTAPQIVNIFEHFKNTRS